MFRRKQADDTEAKLRAMFDGRLEEFSGMAPATFPDGSPFPAREHMARLADVGVRCLAYEDVELSRYCLSVMATFACLQTESPTASQAAMALEARQRLAKYGAAEDERALSAALLACADWWEQAGREIIDDLNAQ